MRRRQPTGTVYVLHFTSPFKHAKHYTGWAADFAARLAQHRSGTGARLMQVIAENGIGFEVAKTFQGTRTDERRLKNRGGASRHCPICQSQTIH